ncbi:Uncharacterised protein [Actinomyces howellii]|uniref:DUF4440 domain-containing protein n=1 Tax=Actinomyces howellii TaxID=52771 RepID=A0A448HHE0_9ACTO|nr:Uncharacterised protein [Actinomyces howellii]
MSDPDAVADAFAVTAVVRDARTDTSSTDAQARASQWCVPSLAVTEGAELERPDGEWTAMQEHEAYDVVDEIDRTIDDPVPDTTTAYRMRTVTTHAEAEDGWRGQTRTTQLWITLEQSPEGAWQVSAVTSRVEEGEPA